MKKTCIVIIHITIIWNNFAPVHVVCKAKIFHYLHHSISPLNESLYTDIYHHDNRKGNPTAAEARCKIFQSLKIHAKSANSPPPIDQEGTAIILGRHIDVVNSHI